MVHALVEPPMICLITALLALGDWQKPSDPDAVAMWVDDLGRLTPFGRTFDVYIQSGFDPDFSYHLLSICYFFLVKLSPLFL